MRIFVPRNQSASFSNPPIHTYLRALGFSDITEVSDETVSVGDVRIRFLPFFGEPFGCNSHFDAFTYHVDLGGFSFYGSIDACADERGDMEAVFRSVGKQLRPDLFLFGASNQVHSNGYSASGPRYLSNELQWHPSLMRYHPNVADVERWIETLRPRFVMPFAQFILNGRSSADLSVNSLASNAIDAYDEYWKDFAPDRFPAEWVATWRSQLEYLRNLKLAKLLMLHPFQGLLL